MAVAVAGAVASLSISMLPATATNEFSYMSKKVRLTGIRRRLKNEFNDVVPLPWTDLPLKNSSLNIHPGVIQSRRVSVLPWVLFTVIQSRRVLNRRRCSCFFELAVRVDALEPLIATKVKPVKGETGLTSPICP